MKTPRKPQGRIDAGDRLSIRIVKREKNAVFLEGNDLEITGALARQLGNLFGAVAFDENADAIGMAPTTKELLRARLPEIDFETLGALLDQNPGLALAVAEDTHQDRTGRFSLAAHAKMLALAADAKGGRQAAKRLWLAAARHELHNVECDIDTDDEATRAQGEINIGEVVACLAMAIAPLGKDDLAAVAIRFHAYVTAIDTAAKKRAAPR